MNSRKSVLLVSILSLGCLLASPQFVEAQNPPATPQPEQAILPGVTNAESGSLFLDQLTNVAFVGYGAYVESSHKMGGGLMAIYNVSDNLGTGAGVEMIGNHASVLSGNIQFKVPTHPLTFLGLPAFTATPWAGAFLGKSIGSNGASGAAIGTGGGLYVDVCSLGKGWILSAGGGAVDWSGAGRDFDGWHILGFAGVHHGF